eukprot:TRINITY_DN3096_c0_g2_i1.p3 TRINITY_DN3096_c0_g2~~TRINITY_DN3096_c0_g2_i1.p3  ORF type:complete len:119 (-),score=17.73 TRINITY_DN3096_c0_g2_i1:734-1090(-)
MCTQGVSSSHKSQQTQGFELCHFFRHQVPGGVTFLASVLQVSLVDHVQVVLGSLQLCGDHAPTTRALAFGALGHLMLEAPQTDPAAAQAAVHSLVVLIQVLQTKRAPVSVLANRFLAD